ncbi:phenylalanine--tRNA ligase subunit alpha [Kiritimatiella glycovorans]|uniref:Phenylalanine--tRNA ligase alpha subunit n=1 Tax=Kiritimatiella glycovorans TaxID=1307763 RepID=A0A0G3EEY5_9BACT|nr:phenylalanine--tRNA ligase subunit alpha [Kiritimatiella glycovorans]AKJ63305.1 Phenylalanine--tRNA ligase alpha subunit [Kiritimatiella glycovorans]
MDTRKIEAIKGKALEEAAGAAGPKELEGVRVRYLGRRGRVTEIMAGIRDVPPEERREYGQAANALKQELSERIESRKAEFESSAATGAVEDPTRPGEWRGLGREHPISRITGRITDIFRTLGFTVATGPDIETVYHNFDALNTPADHPSRDEQDTFYLENGDLLRCHTSPVQVRYMEAHPPPVRIIAPGRCYRRDTPDATHSANFHQVEGLYVDRDVTLADLKGTIAYFARELMGDDVEIRFRPHFFPFTEPSVEVDFTCHMCRGSGCRVCKQSGWIEIMGAGMVDPNVFEAVGFAQYDVTGFAFGMGIERIAMIMYGIEDIRLLYENDVRFLAQF